MKTNAGVDHRDWNKTLHVHARACKKVRRGQQLNDLSNSYVCLKLAFFAPAHVQPAEVGSIIALLSAQNPILMTHLSLA